MEARDSDIARVTWPFSLWWGQNSPEADLEFEEECNEFHKLTTGFVSIPFV
jgi:hypothetical protein